MSFEESRLKVSHYIAGELYRRRLHETLFNTQNRRAQEQGWVLKSGKNSPTYFNLRPIGDAPNLLATVSYEMNILICKTMPHVNVLVGVEMAGIPLVATIALANGPGTKAYRFAYTRPLPGTKVRTPDEALKRLDEIYGESVHGYGQKDLVEGRFYDGDRICIVDDMVTTFGSKMIAKQITRYELDGRGVEDVHIDDVAVVVDREQGAAEEAAKNNMNLQALVRYKSDRCMDVVQDLMHPAEREVMADYLANPAKYDNPVEWQKVLQLAKQVRGE